MTTKENKIYEYLNKNYQFVDQHILKSWVSYLNNPQFVKQKNDKILLTSEGTDILSKYLTLIRKHKTKDFKIRKQFFVSFCELNKNIAYFDSIIHQKNY